SLQRRDAGLQRREGRGVGLRVQLVRGRVRAGVLLPVEGGLEAVDLVRGRVRAGVLLPVEGGLEAVDLGDGVLVRALRLPVECGLQRRDQTLRRVDRVTGL